jgi:hypothetical protein
MRTDTKAAALRLASWSAEEIVSAEIVEEYRRAAGKFARFNSAHEGWAVLREEVDELWDEVKSKSGTRASMRVEAVQVAAMALRFVLEVCDAE